MNPLTYQDNLSESFESPIIVALDFNNVKKAIDFTRKLDPSLCKLKVGLELFSNGGRQLVEQLISQGFKVFLDLKYHDIPSTVSKACRVAADIGVWMLTMHASGGKNMMETSVNTLAHYNNKPLLIGVTVLTSMSQTDIDQIGFTKQLNETVVELALLAQQSGLDGMVSSAQELHLVKPKLSKSFKYITPGIRLNTDKIDDQKRVMTPNEALKLGSSFLVIGRAITKEENPLEILIELNKEAQDIYQKTGSTFI